LMKAEPAIFGRSNPRLFVSCPRRGTKVLHIIALRAEDGVAFYDQIWNPDDVVKIR
jgi:hypothetical protein